MRQQLQQDRQRWNAQLHMRKVSQSLSDHHRECTRPSLARSPRLAIQGEWELEGRTFSITHCVTLLFVNTSVT